MERRRWRWSEDTLVVCDESKTNGRVNVLLPSHTDRGEEFRRVKGKGKAGEVTHYRENRHERHYSAAELLLDPEMRPLARGTGASKPVFSFVKVLFDSVRTYVGIRVQLDLTLCSVKCIPILFPFSRYIHRVDIYVRL